MGNERKKIIVVDDNIENLTALKNTLKDLHEVYPSSSALEMFDLLEHVHPDLILLDIEMPGINGYDAIKKLKGDTKYQQIPIIFLTYMIDEQSEMEGLKLGAVDYIHKPFVTPVLLQRIEIHLSLMEQQKIIRNRNKEIEELLELKTMEVRAREAAELEAQKASQAKGDFLAHMSHEIRSPLNAVIGMINLASEAEDILTVKRYLEKAGTASRFVLGIINDILDMSKIEADKFELSYGEFSFGETLSGIINVVSARAEEKHQHITVNADKNIPPEIIGDELRLSQVITNLLTNAIKFTPEGGKIDLNAEKLEEKDNEVTLKIEVADSGIGISPEQQKKLFTSYNQADSSISKNFGGTGLGLAISKRIIELMQGTIWIESELGKGAKFIFTIKAKKGTMNAAKTTITGSSAGIKGTDFDFSKYTILVAEDMAFNREILAKYLEKTRISIDFAENGQLAVSMFAGNPDRYDLIFTDIHMPEMDGVEATKVIRALDLPQAKDITIIAMTADAFKEDIDKCLSAGMNDHIAKPVVPKDIYAMLKKYLDSGKTA